MGHPGRVGGKDGMAERGCSWVRLAVMEWVTLLLNSPLSSWPCL